MNIIAFILLFLIEGIRPLLGPANCKYPVGCTAYARQQFESEPFLKAFKNICQRILSCNPFTR